jgi:hypothetical protein
MTAADVAADVVVPVEGIDGHPSPDDAVGAQPTSDAQEIVDALHEAAKAEPDEDVFEFTPRGDETDDYGDIVKYDKPIVVPAMKKVIPPEKSRVFWARLNDLRGLEQPKYWLERAKPDTATYWRIRNLSDKEWERFHTEWMNPIGVTPGE